MGVLQLPLFVAAIIGAFIFVWGYLWGEADMLDAKLGAFLLGIAGACAVAAIYIASERAITVKMLMDQDVHGLASRIPFYALALGTCGACIVAAWLVRRWKRLPPDHDRH